MNIHVERRLAGGARQHIQHLDALGGGNPTNVQYNAEVDFSQRYFTWDGCPIQVRDAQDPDPTVIASRAEGPETIGGLDPANPARRVFPVVNIGECVPPSTYHVVLRIMEGTAAEHLFHSESWTVGVAQVVRVTMTEEARQVLRQPQVLNNGTVVAEAMPEGMVNGLCEAISDSCNNTYAGLNIRFRTGECRAPHAELRVINDPSSSLLGWVPPEHFDFLNDNPKGLGFLNVAGCRGALERWRLRAQDPELHLTYGLSNPFLAEHKAFTLPVPADHFQTFMKIVSGHECGHLLGLVFENSNMGGSNSHNPQPWTRRQVMNPGAHDLAATARDFLGLNGVWTFRQVNSFYLQLILPVATNNP